MPFRNRCVKLLLNIQILLWAAGNPDRFSMETQTWIDTQENEFFQPLPVFGVDINSFWLW